MPRWFAAIVATLALAFGASGALAQEGEEAVEAPALPRVALETTMGTIVIDLETVRAPITAANFLRYVEEKRFDGTVFYRAMRNRWGEQPNGLIQGGTANDPKRVLDPIAHEPTSETGVRHLRGTISMARYDPGTATGDFSIMLAPQPGLDAQPNSDNPDLRPGFAAFGQVVEGMAVVESIFDAPISETKGEGFMRGQMLEDPVEIVAARVVEPN